MMQEIAASLLMEFEKWVLQAESSGTILKTPLDSQASLSSEEVFMFRCPDFILFFSFLVALCENYLHLFYIYFFFCG